MGECICLPKCIQIIGQPVNSSVCSMDGRVLMQQAEKKEAIYAYPNWSKLLLLLLKKITRNKLDSTTEK